MIQYPDKFLDIENIAEHLLDINIWPSTIRVDEAMGMPRTGYSASYIRRWKDKIGLKKVNSRTVPSTIPKKQKFCGNGCSEFVLIYRSKRICPIHFTIKDCDVEVPA